MSYSRTISESACRPGMGSPSAMDLSNVEAANRCFRDIIALSTLPSVWLGAKPLRIAESLLAAIDTTLAPRLAYIHLPAEEDHGPINLATVDRHSAPARVVEELAGVILPWAAQHDPDDLLLLALPEIPGQLRLCVYPLGFNAEAGVLAVGFTEPEAPTRIHRTLLSVAANQALVAWKNTTLRQQAESSRLEAEALNKVVRILAAELDLQTVLQKTTDAATELTGAQCGAFVAGSPSANAAGGLLYTMTGIPPQALKQLENMSSADFFGPAFLEKGPLRISDVLSEPPGISPHQVMTQGFEAIRSYLAVPVVSRSGHILGGLFFGHRQPGMFRKRAERLAIGIATQAAIAMDNACLYSQAQKEIADRTRVEKTLRDTQARLDATLAAAEIATWTWDIQKDRMVADKNSARWFSLSPEASTGAPIETFKQAIHPEDLPAVELAVAEALQKGTYEMEYRIVQPDGSNRWVVARGKVEYDPSGNPAHFPGVIIDITERRKAEAKLRESEQRFRFMAESMPQKIFTVNRNGHPEYFNQQWLHFTGLSLQQIGGWPWSQFVHPDDLPENTSRWNHSMSSGNSFQMEHRFRRKDGVYRWHLSRAHAMHDAEGRVLMWIGASTDIDDQKRWSENLERAVQERTLQLKETIADLEAFSYSISHDLRAPLRSMKSFSEMLAEECAPQLSPTALAYIRRITTSASRMDRLILDVLNYSRISRGELRLEPVNLQSLLEGILESYPNLRSLDALISIKTPLPLVQANEAALTQCLSNLLGNALKFVAQGVRPQVQVWAEQHPNYVRLFVQDNGIGIPEDSRDHIFAIFQRLSTHYEGTGIGLAIVKKAMERMGGKVGLQSEVGKGTTFWLDLPPA